MRPRFLATQRWPGRGRFAAPIYGPPESGRLSPQVQLLQLLVFAFLVLDPKSGTLGFSAARRLGICAFGLGQQGASLTDLLQLAPAYAVQIVDIVETIAGNLQKRSATSR
jgi:hypothetical protein